MFFIADFCAIESFSFANPDPQVKTTVINITETTISKIVAINGERDLFLSIIKKIKDLKVYNVILKAIFIKKSNFHS